MADDFQERYKQAVHGLTDEQMEQVVKLNPFRLREWVDSPEKVRPFLLKRWQSEDEEHKSKREEIKKGNWWTKKRCFDPF